MEKSSVTEYILNYMTEHNLSSSVISKQTGIAEKKLCSGYGEPLLADEFLRLCAYLKISPEKIRENIYHT